MRPFARVVRISAMRWRTFRGGLAVEFHECPVCFASVQGHSARKWHGEWHEELERQWAEMAGQEVPEPSEDVPEDEPERERAYANEVEFAPHEHALSGGLRAVADLFQWRRTGRAVRAAVRRKPGEVPLPAPAVELRRQQWVRIDGLIDRTVKR